MNNMINTKGSGRRGIKATEANPNSRHVTFSKRRVGLFKKASELCTLTGAECAILCESVAGRVFAFGHPTVESVVDKYLGDHKSSSEINDSVTDMINSTCMHEKLNKQYLEIAKEIEIEKNRSQGDHVKNNSDNVEKGDLYWWEQPFDHLEVQELEEYVSSMEELMNKLKLRADDLMLIKSSPSIFKTLNNSDDAGLSDLVTENLNNLDFSDDGFLNVLLAMKDDELHDFFNDLELRDNTVEATDHVYGDTGKELKLPPNHGDNAVLHDYGRAADLRDSDASGVLPNEFSGKFAPN